MGLIKKIAGISLASAIVIGGTGAVANQGVKQMNAYAQEESNLLFEQDKVNQDMIFYGGDEGYLKMKGNVLRPFTEDKVKLYNHFNTGKKGPIKVGYDYTVNDEQIKQFQYTFDHLNDVFEVVNKNYQFSTGRFTEEESDIWVDFTSLMPPSGHDGTIIGAYVDWNFDAFNNSTIRSAKIHFNNSVNFATPELRYFMLHEMQHILFGSLDLDPFKQEGFSTYSAFDMNFIIRQISCAYESVEDYKNGVIKNIGGHWKNLLEITDKDGNPIGRPYLPLMTREEKNSFVSLLPIDASTIVALYGDSSKPENKQAYLKLLNDILEKNRKVFDIDHSVYYEHSTKYTSQPYYDDDYTLPKPEDEEGLGM